MTFVRLFFALCFCTVAYCGAVDNEADSSLILPEICNSGPEVWCQNFTTSVQCKAVKHCVQTVWSKANLMPSNSCSTCITSLDTFRKTVNSNTTKDAIEQGLDYICELTIVTRILRKQCEELINDYLDKNINEILDLLNSNIDSKTICHMFRFCSIKPKPSQDDEVLASFDNIVLHFPSHNIKLIDLLLPQNLEIPQPQPPKLLGAEKCTWGPSYWCGNITTSKTCKMTSHCISKVWSKKVFGEDSDSICQVCKNMVQQARDQLLSNETQEELKEVFEGSCKLIPIKDVRKECITLADDFVPELTEMLASEMNPTAVCSVAGLCNSPRIDDLLAAEPKALADLSAMNSCVNCTVAFTSFHRYLSSTSKDRVLQSLMAVCGELSSYSDLCTALVMSNFDELYETITSQLPPLAACHLTGMCSTKYHLHMSPDDEYFKSNVDTMLAVQGDDLPCDLCKQLVTHLRDVLVANTTEEEFQQMLHGICQQLGQFKDQCLQIIDADFKMIYNYLVSELNETLVCTEINICPKARTLLDNNSKNLISGRGPMVPTLLAEGNLTNLFPLTHKAKIADVECRFCKMVITEIQQELQNPKYEKNIELVLEKICWLMPSKDNDECRTFIAKYSDTLISILAAQTDPNVVCALLAICPQVSAPLAPRTSYEWCPICKSVTLTLKQILDNPKYQNKVKEALEKVCTVVPQAEQDKCNQYISQYSSLLLSILAEETDPAIVCPTLKLCPSSVSPQDRCNHCQQLLISLIDQLRGDRQIGHLETAINALMPAKRDEKRAVAAELKTSYRKDLIDMLMSEFDADESCVLMEFCNPKSMHSLVDAAPRVDLLTNDISMKVVGKPSCEICEMLVKMYEKELTSNTTEKKLEDMLNELCSKLKNPDLKAKCIQSVDEYVPIILDQLKKDVTPKELCAAAKLCSLRSLTNKVTECRACELAVGGLESILGDPTYQNNIDGKVVEEAEHVCNFLSNRSKTICVDLVDQIVPQVEGIVFNVPAWFVCSKLKMCPYGDQIDTTVCSTPDLWCQDVKSAFVCDKLMYCKKTAWKVAIP